MNKVEYYEGKLIGLRSDISYYKQLLENDKYRVERCERELKDLNELYKTRNEVLLDLRTSFVHNDIIDTFGKSNFIVCEIKNHEEKLQSIRNERDELKEQMQEIKKRVKRHNLEINNCKEAIPVIEYLLSEAKK